MSSPNVWKLDNFSVNGLQYDSTNPWHKPKSYPDKLRQSKYLHMSFLVYSDQIICCHFYLFCLTEISLTFLMILFVFHGWFTLKKLITRGLKYHSTFPCVQHGVNVLIYPAEQERKHKASTVQETKQLLIKTRLKSSVSPHF